MSYYRWLLTASLFTGCSPRLRYASEAESAATGLVVRVGKVNAFSGGELALSNNSSMVYFITSPYHCSVFLTLYDAQHKVLMPNRKTKRYCNSAEAGPVRLEPGQIIRYALESPRNNHDDAELQKGRYFQVTYQGSITTSQNAKRAQKFTHYTFNVTGATE